MSADPTDDTEKVMAQFYQSATQFAECMADMAAVAARMQQIMLTDAEDMLRTLKELEERREAADQEQGDRE